LRNYRKQTAKASVAGSAPSDKVVAAKPAAASTTLPTVTQAPPVSATTPRVKLQNGGWLQKYGNGGQVPKYFFGKLLSKLKRNDDGKVVVDSTPEFIQLPVHQGWEDAKAQIELMPSVPMLQPYMGYNPGSDIAMKYAIKSPDITKIYAPKSQKEILDIAMN
jgi:hypothetical protein